MCLDIIAFSIHRSKSKTFLPRYECCLLRKNTSQVIHKYTPKKTKLPSSVEERSVLTLFINDIENSFLPSVDSNTFPEYWEIDSSVKPLSIEHLIVPTIRFPELIPVIIKKSSKNKSPCSTCRRLGIKSEKCAKVIAQQLRELIYGKTNTANALK